MIHNTAIISKSAEIDQSVEIGPFCVIGDKVKIANGTKILSHVVIDGKTTIGKNNKIFPFSTIGLIPQDLKFKGEDSQLIIGDNNTIREHTTLHLGTADGGGITKIGSHNLLMVGVHIAHDCLVGDHVILANNATIAGHVIIGNHVVIGGLSAVHQFVRIGEFAMVGGMSGVESDVIPYGLVMGERASLAGLNLVGMKRNEISRDEIHALRNFYKLIFNGQDSSSFVERANKIATEFSDKQTVKIVTDFINSETTRSFCQPKN